MIRFAAWHNRVTRLGGRALVQLRRNRRWGSPRSRAPGPPVQKNLRAPASVKERAQQRDKPSLGFARTSPNEDECKNQLPFALTLSSTTITVGCCPSACDDRGRSLSASLTVLLRVLRFVLSATRFHRLDSSPPTPCLLSYGAVKHRASE